MKPNVSKNSGKKGIGEKRLHFEALEPRILFDASAPGAPTAEVSIQTEELTTNEDQLINDDISFTITFDNNGGQEGYLPYLDIVADPEMVLQDISAFGNPLTNPDGSGLTPIGMISGTGELVSIGSGVPVDHPLYSSSIGSPSSDFIGGAGSGTQPVNFDPALAGSYVYSVALPFGSYTPGNPPIEVDVTASLNQSDGILPSTDYALTARGGYALGCDPLDNPGTVASPDDEPVFGASATTQVHPVVMSLVKDANDREEDGAYTGENVSGPNHPITFQLELDIATGELVSGLTLTDVLPDDLAYLGNLTVTDGSGGLIPFTINSQPAVNTDNLSGVTSTDNTISINLGDITGVNGTDVIVTYDTFVPYVEEGGDLVVDDVSGEEGDRNEYNDAEITGTWRGTAVGDDAGPLAGGDPDGVLDERETDYQIEEHSIAIQKGVDFAPGGDRGNTGWAEGDVAQYTMNFQISDYFAFDNVIVSDTLGDGLEFLPDLASPSSWPNAGDFSNDALELRPSLNFNMHGAGSITVDFDEGNFTAVENADGTTNIVFDVYQQLIDSGYIMGGDPLTGGMIPAAGIDPALMGAFNSGVATQGSITYRARVRDEFASTPGNPHVSQGDTLVNSVSITGRNLDVETFTPGVNVTDGSSALIEIESGTVTKELFSATRNGNQQLVADLEDNLEVVPGDVVTWRVTYDLPLSEFDSLFLTDFLPLPVFDASTIDTSQVYGYSDPGYLTGGRISFGQNNTFHGSSGPGVSGGGGIDENAGYPAPDDPIITIDTANNAVAINFGEYIIAEGQDPVSTTVEIFISTVVQEGVYADGLPFTNQVGASEDSSFDLVASSNEIANIRLVVPDLNVTKGVLATDSGGTFTGSTGPAGVTFQPPGSANAFTGTINSNGLAGNPVDANVANLDAGDEVTFGILVENVGESQYGAFDVNITDTVPAGFAVPATLGELNLRVTDGAGNPLTFTINGGGTTPADFFANGIQLTDPGPNQGALTEINGTSGANIVLVAYDLTLEDIVVPNQTLTNTAAVTNFSYFEGGVNQAQPDDMDTASVTVVRPTVNKSLIDTSHDDTSNLDGEGEVAVGEVVTYEVTINIPEGTMPMTRIFDTLPAGMAFIGLDSISFDPALSTTAGAGDFSDVEAFYNAGASVLELGTTGNGAGLGTLFNSDTDNSTAETITFRYRAVVLNDAVNQSGLIRTNDATIQWQESGANQSEDDSVNVRVVEPNLGVDKVVLGGDTSVEGDETVTYRITIRNENMISDGMGGMIVDQSVSEAYDVALSDILPNDVEFVSAVFVSGVNPDGVAMAGDPVTFNAGTGPEGEVAATYARIGAGEVSVIDVTVTIDPALTTDTVITNTADIEFSSIAGDPGDGGYTGFDANTPLGPGVNPADPIYNIAAERTGDPTDPGGAANDYIDNDNANVTVINPVGIDKLVIDTSEDHTGADATVDGAVTATIGEVVRFEVRIQIPQATNNMVELVDVLGPEFVWIDEATNDIQFRLEGFANDGSTLSASPDIEAAITGPQSLDPSRVDFVAGTNTVTFDFGDIINTEADATPEYIYVSYNTIIRNDGSVSGGDTATNTVQLREGGANLGAPLQQSLSIVEPALTILKSDNGVTTADAGDIIDYTLTVTASGGMSNSTAFDLAILDTLPDELDLVGGTLMVTGVPAASTVLTSVEDTGADSISVTVDLLEPGESFQITFQAEVRDTGGDIIRADELVVNTASLGYSSVPGDGTDNGVGGNTTGNESGTPDTVDGERVYSAMNSDDFSSPPPVLSKVLGDPADTTYTIGEQVEYVITLNVPEGALGNPDAFILDQIDPGFRYVPGTLAVTTDPGLSFGTAGALNEANNAFFTHTDPGDIAQSESLRFDFGDITYNDAMAADGVNVNGTIEIRYMLQVENILANQAGQQRNNTAQFSYTDETGVATSTVADSTGDTDTIITIVEPQVDSAKSITSIPANPQAGDTVAYQVTFTNPASAATPNQNVTAFDLTARDVLPANLDLQTASFTAMLGMTDISSQFTVTTDGWSTTPTADIDLAPGETITITYNTVIANEVRDGDLLTNEVDVEWTSLDGTVVGERGGDGDLSTTSSPLNDYEDGTDEDFRVDFSPVFDFTKTIRSTSETSTGMAAGTSGSVTDLVVGETVTYALTATIGRGTTDGIRIEDVLSTANGLLDITNVQIEAGAALSLANGNPFTSIIPTVTDSIGADSYNDTVVVNFGSIVNDPALSTGVADEQLTVLVTAIVRNDIANQQGDIITNTGDFFYQDDPDGDGTRTEQNIESSINVEIVEPHIDAAKSITSIPAEPTAGDTVSYQVTLTHPGGPANQQQNVTAFDISVQDVLPMNLAFQGGSFTATLNGITDVSSLFDLNASGWSDAAGSSLDMNPGDVIVITYDAVIGAGIRDGDTLTNQVDIEWTSTDGMNADERGGDGNLNTQSPGGDPDDYEDRQTASFDAEFTNTFDFTKTVFSTSETATGMDGGTNATTTDLVIGETVTYALTTTLGRGVTDGVRIVDQLAIDNGLLNITGVTFTAGNALSLTSGANFSTITPTISDALGTDGINDRVELNFGSITNDPAFIVNPEDEQLVVYVTAVVVNLPENQEGDVIANEGSFFYFDDPDGDGTQTEQVQMDTENVEILEPNLSITKTVNNSQPRLDEVLTYTLRVTNNAGTSATDAFDLVIDDMMDPRMTLDPMSVQLNILGAPANPSMIVSNTSTANNLVLQIDRLEEGEVIEITYDVRVSDNPDDFDAVLPNSVDLDYTSTEGTNPDERGGDPTGPGDPNDYEDDDTISVEVFQPDLVIEKVDNDAIITVGELVVYEMTVTNQGRASALGVTITDDITEYLDAGFEFVSGTNATLMNGIVTFVLPDMPVSDVQMVTLELRAPDVIPAGLESITNSATANHDDIDPTIDDNTDTEETPIDAVPDLVVAKDDGLLMALTGDEITYTLTFSNVGDQIASGVELVDTLPEGVRFISATGGGMLNANNEVVWTLDGLAPGGEFFVEVLVEVVEPGLLVNVVTITDDGTGGPDPTPENNRDEDETISERRYRYDVNQEFTREVGNRAHDPGLHHRIVGGHEDAYARREPVVLATHMNSGLAQPGSTISLTVFDESGNRIGETSVMADAGGNWMATFPNANIDRQPARIEMQQTWSSYDPTGERSYNFRTYFGPAFSSGTYYTEALTVLNVTEKRAATEVIDLYEASKMVLALDWNGTPYEIAARGALQSSSSN